MHEETNDFSIVSAGEKLLISLIFILIGLAFQIYFVMTEQASQTLRIRQQDWKNKTSGLWK